MIREKITKKIKNTETPHLDPHVDDFTFFKSHLCKKYI